MLLREGFHVAYVTNETRFATSEDCHRKSRFADFISEFNLNIKQIEFVKVIIENIIEQGLALPHRDFRPETLEEQAICYADKFYSKSHLERERTVEQTAKSLEKFGAAGVEIFLNWAQRFESYTLNN